MQRFGIFHPVLCRTHQHLWLHISSDTLISVGRENTSVSISDLHWTPTYLEGNETSRAFTSWNWEPQILYLLRKRYNSVVAIITSHSALPNEEQVTCCLLESGPDFSQITLPSSLPCWIKVCPSVCFLAWLVLFCGNKSPHTLLKQHCLRPTLIP